MIDPEILMASVELIDTLVREELPRIVSRTCLIPRASICAHLTLDRDFWSERRISLRGAEESSATGALRRIVIR